MERGLYGTRNRRIDYGRLRNDRRCSTIRSRDINQRKSQRKGTYNVGAINGLIGGMTLGGCMAIAFALMNR